MFWNRKKGSDHLEELDHYSNLMMDQQIYSQHLLHGLVNLENDIYKVSLQVTLIMIGLHGLTEENQHHYQMLLVFHQDQMRQ